MKKKLAILLPGIGYHKDKPLLYYASKLVKSLGYEVINIEYHNMPQKIQGDEKMMKKAAEVAYMNTKEQLAGVDFSAYEEVVFVGKSIGTVALAKYISDYEPGVKDVTQIWYTPVEATFSFASRNVTAFIGESDPWSDLCKVKEMAAKQNIKLYTYPEGNHSLETGDVERDIAYLSEVMRITKEVVCQTNIPLNAKVTASTY
ncbi:MAG: alpha/beta hydrolase [Lachnospiraceae bacterium]|nr:alpha/beta hydrolase [Lachnospiraceae bacterium]